LARENPRWGYQCIVGELKGSGSPSRRQQSGGSCATQNSLCKRESQTFVCPGIQTLPFHPRSGIAILAPVIACRRNDAKEDEARTLVGFRTVYVFDVEQTDGAPLPQPAEIGGDPGDKTASLKTAIASRQIVIEYADNLGGALGLSCGRCIQSRPGGATLRPLV